MGTQYLSIWFVVVIILFIIFIVFATWLVFFSERSNCNTGCDSPTHDDKQTRDPVYQLVWATDFSGPLEQKGEFDYVRWAVPVMSGDQTGDNEEGFYTDRPENIELIPVNPRDDDDKRHKLILRVTNDEVFIKDVDGARNYPYSTARIVSTASFATGLFVVKASMPRTQQGIWPFIRLHPLENIANHKIGSIYGSFPACGEIDMFDPVRHTRSYGKKGVRGKGKRTSDLQWTGRLIYGGSGEGEEIINPPQGEEKLFPPIDDDEPRSFGLEWTEQHIAWYLDPKVDLNGHLTGGKLLQKIPASEWYTLDPNGKKLLPPAPFDVPFHIGIGIAVGGDRYCRSSRCQPPVEVIDQEMVIESVAVYQNARIN